MSIDRRDSDEQGAAGSPRRRRWYVSLRAIVLTWASIAAAPIGWASIDSADAMGFRGHVGPQRPGTYRQVFRAPTRTRRAAISDHRHWGSNHLISRQPPPGEARNPRHPFRPHPPIVGGIPPSLPPAPIGVTNAAPPIPPGPSGAGVGAGAGGPAALVAAASDPPYVPDEVLVSFAANVPPPAIVRFAQDQRLALLGIHRLSLINRVLYRFRITDRRQVPAVIGGAQRDARVATMQPNYFYRMQDAGTAQATATDMQYVVRKLHLPQAHDLATGNHVLVAVIDTGIDLQHPELRGAVAAGFDAIRGDIAPQRHGTAMASAIVAHDRLMGVAPAAHILAVRAFEGEAAGARSTTTRLLDALQWTASSAARVVNMSFAGPADPAIHQMIAAARKKGMVLVAAAGNDGPQAPPDYPAAYPEVIAVTATDADNHLLKVANHGAYVAVAAPGVEIFVATPNAGYGYTTGTSVATAHVSGLVALLLERNPRLSPDAVQAILMRTAKHLGPTGRDDEFGAGLIDAYAAVLAVSPTTAVGAR